MNCALVAERLAYQFSSELIALLSRLRQFSFKLRQEKLKRTKETGECERLKIIFAV